jgi:hypothetical protein
MVVNSSNDRATRRAGTWLGRHGLDGASPTPLLLARLAVRRRARVATSAGLVCLGVLTIAVMNTRGWSTAAQPLLHLLPFVIVFLAGVLVRWAWQRVVRLGDRRIAAGLTRRAAHPTPPGWRALLGRRGIAITAVTYTGSLAVAVAAATLGRTDQDRALVVILFLVLAALAAITAAEVAEAVRRPALADDATSLAVDDALRAEDARAAATSPTPAMMATFTAMTLSPDAASSLTVFCYILVGFAILAEMWDQSSAPSRPVTAS